MFAVISLYDFNGSYFSHLIACERQLFQLRDFYGCLSLLSFGDGYLSKTISAAVGGPLGTAKDLTFVSVLDKDGRPLRQASTVEVWNTQKNNIKTYPIIGTATI